MCVMGLWCGCVVMLLCCCDVVLLCRCVVGLLGYWFAVVVIVACVWFVCVGCCVLCIALLRCVLV